MNMRYIVFGGIAVLAVIGLMGGLRVLNDSELMNATDSSKIKYTVNIGVDSWAGYFVLCSKEMRRLSLEREVLVKCHDDQANYPARMSNLESGDLEMAVATVDGYVAIGDNERWPGSILFVIDESQGGDAIIANRNIATNTDDLKNKTGLRIAYTGNSPSQTLLTAWKHDFNVPIDDPAFFTIVKSNGSADAYAKLINGEVDVAVLWEPDVSKALANANFVKLLGTESTKNLIVDVLLVDKDLVLKEPQVVQDIVDSYFIALEHYDTHPDEFSSEIATYSGVKLDQVDTLRQGINWIDLPHNASDWLGISHNGSPTYRQLYNTIEASVRLLINNGDLSNNPLPNQDPFRIINSSPFGNTFNAGIAGDLGITFQAIIQVVDTSVTRQFKKRSPGRWLKMTEVGSLSLQPIRFKTGTADLAPPKQGSFNTLVEMLSTYPNYRIKIVGHSGKRGDKMANMNLSKQRSLAAARHLEREYGIHKHRMYAYGVGNQQPPVRSPGEKSRAYNSRWPRVELILVEE